MLWLLLAMSRRTMVGRFLWSDRCSIVATVKAEVSWSTLIEVHMLSSAMSGTSRLGPGAFTRQDLLTLRFVEFTLRAAVPI